MKVLVIGSKGFIGSYLVDYFWELGFDVWQCDVVTDYTQEKYFQIDATNSDFGAIFEQQRYDVCVNCSGAASVPESIKHPHRDFVLNTANVYAILNAIHTHNSGCKYINLSSAAVYGNPQQLPITEEHQVAPMSPYGFHKVMAEQIVKEFAIEFNEKVCSLRIFSAFGAGLKKQIFWDMNKKMNESNNAVFWGTGEESRDFIHVRDIVRIIKLVIDNASFCGETINVANGIQTRIADAVSIFAHLKAYKGAISFNGIVREGDPRFWQADISIIKKWGYKESVSLEQGLKDYIEWIEKI